MAISLKDLKKVSMTKQPINVIYGPQGRGKTTLCAVHPNTVFIQVEDGTPAGHELISFGRPKTFDEMIEMITALRTEAHPFQHLAIDTLDAFEKLVWDKTCQEKGWTNIEDVDYGKGYVMAENNWWIFMREVEALRNERNMMVSMIAHAQTERFDSPQYGPFTRYTLNTHKRASAILLHEADNVLFMDYHAQIKNTDVGFNKEIRTAQGGEQLFIYTQGAAGYIAKSRADFPGKILFPKGKPIWDELRKYLPALSTPAKKGK